TDDNALSSPISRRRTLTGTRPALPPGWTGLPIRASLLPPKELPMVKRDFGRVALLHIAGAALSCQASGPESTGASRGSPAGAACAVDDGAIRQWIQQPSLPSDPAGTGNACFWSFAWQEL